MRILALTLSVLTLAQTVTAQNPHPCDDSVVACNPKPQNQNTTVTFCWNRKDESGADAFLVAANLYIDGGLYYRMIRNGEEIPPALSAPNAEGLYYYEFPPLLIQKGPHSFQVQLEDPDGAGAHSDALNCRLPGKPIGKPDSVKVK